MEVGHGVWMDPAEGSGALHGIDAIPGPRPRAGRGVAGRALAEQMESGMPMLIPIPAVRHRYRANGRQRSLHCR